MGRNAKKIPMYHLCGIVAENSYYQMCSRSSGSSGLEMSALEQASLGELIKLTIQILKLCFE